MKYRSILADPPWKFKDKLDKSRTLPYKNMTIQDLICLPVSKLVEKEAHLYLWCPTTLIDEGIYLMEMWGFDYKTIVVWQKLTKYGKKWFGMGHYFRNSVEVCLFGTINNLKTRTNDTRNSFDAKKPSRHHSAKPDEMYEIIENNSYPPYLELFATKKRENWDSLGFQIDNKDIRDSIEELIIKLI